MALTQKQKDAINTFVTNFVSMFQKEMEVVRELRDINIKVGQMGQPFRRVTLNSLIGSDAFPASFDDECRKALELAFLEYDYRIMYVQTTLALIIMPDAMDVVNYTPICETRCDFQRACEKLEHFADREKAKSKNAGDF